MKKSFFKVIIIIVSLLMIAGCPDPVRGQRPSSGNRPTGGGASSSGVTSVNYTVKHMKQDVSGSGYTEDTSVRQTLSGTSGATTAAQARSFTGFTAQAFSQATIVADGSTVVTINYNRNVHTVSYSATTSGVTAPATASYRFGAQVTVEFPTGISAWQGDNTIYTVTNNTFFMPDLNLNLAEYSFTPDTMASTLATRPENDVDTPYTITLSGTVDLDTITEAISNTEVYVSISLEDCEGLTSLPDNAFAGCDNLTSIVIPETVTSVGTGVFNGCTNIESVTLPGALNQTSIQNALSSLPTNNADSSYSIEITNVTTEDQISDLKTAINSSGKFVELSLEHCTELTSLPANTFQGCENLTSIIIPSTVTSLGASAFKNCTNLESIELPSSVTSIGNSAFQDCTSLDDIELPSSITSIGERAFLGCENLTSIVMPSTVTSIGDYAFQGCISLENIELSSSITSIGTFAFNCCFCLVSITIPSSVTSIDLEAFRSCFGLESIDIPSSVTSIDVMAFYDCTSLQTINFQGTISQWSNINKEYWWNQNCPSSMRVVCTDGTVTP